MATSNEYCGKAIGRNKKDAEARFRDLKPSYCKGRKLHLEYMETDPPYRVYEVTVQPGQQGEGQQDNYLQ